MSSPHSPASHEDAHEEDLGADADTDDAEAPPNENNDAAAAAESDVSDPGGASSTPRSSSSAQGRADILADLLAAPDSKVDQRINDLRVTRETMKKERKRLSTEIRNEEKKRARLKHRARLLNTNDLLEVYANRVRQEEKRKEKQPGTEA